MQTTAPQRHGDEPHDDAGWRTRVAGLEARLAEANARAESAVSDLEIFSHSMSHDLRAPLRGITGFARLLLEDYAAKLDDDGRRALHLISDEARRMGQLIEDLSGFSRVGRQRLDAAETDMTELARSAFQNLVELKTTPVPALRIEPLPPAHADRVMVRQIFSHLLDNALKFSAARPDAAITVTGVNEGDWNTYCVSDNGVGFDPRYAHKLFGVFHRLHRREDFVGTGVGLAVVRRIAQRHGGRTWAAGEVNGGAKFHFTLPATPLQAGVPPP